MGKQIALLLLLALAGWFGMGQAKASCDGYSTPTCSSQFEARSLAWSKAQSNTMCAGNGWGASTPSVSGGSGTVSGSYAWRATCAAGPFDSGNVLWSGTTGCPTPTDVWNDTTHTCEAPFDSQACLAHNAEDGFKGVGRTVRGFEHACIGGCDFGPAVGGGDGVGVVTTSVVGQAGSTATAATFEFSGNACQTAAPVKTPAETTATNDDPQKCVPAGSGQTFCIKKDGEQCASASNGRQVCWRPTETGEKTDNNILQKRNPGDTPLPPKTPPPDGTTLAQTGTPVTTTTTVTNNNTTTTTTTTTTNYTTNTGTDAGSTSGSGEPGDGSGTSAGSDPTGAGAAVGDGTFGGLPGADGRTKGGIISAFQGRVSNAPMIAAGRNFFTVSVGGGQCPTWTLPATEWTPAIAMDFWCVSSFSGVWSMIGACCLIAFAWLAFRVAVL